MIYLASDHRGYEMKKKVKEWLDEMKAEYADCGPETYNENDDYPDFIGLAAAKIAEDPTNNRGIVFGATGQGEAMVANRRRGVRAIVFYGGPIEIVRLGRLHNAANVLALGVSPGNTIAEGVAIDADIVREAVQVFLSTDFLAEERHVRRLAKLD
ncbi:MAG: RpiB/LacA/LacB family sugar-phosphate isomerase [Candidatus Pacebacteria bacterium]|nr:RpiB/LacA/LacB family sugar-phosphate isomerase [Candidatus Paceibacterota bacterium]